MTLIKDVRDQGLDKFYTNLDIAKGCIERTNEKVVSFFYYYSLFLYRSGYCLAVRSSARLSSQSR